MVQGGMVTMESTGAIIPKWMFIRHALIMLHWTLGRIWGPCLSLAVCWWPQISPHLWDLPPWTCVESALFRTAALPCQPSKITETCTSLVQMQTLRSKKKSSSMYIFPCSRGVQSWSWNEVFPCWLGTDGDECAVCHIYMINGVTSFPTFDKHSTAVFRSVRSQQQT